MLLSSPLSPVSGTCYSQGKFMGRGTDVTRFADRVHDEQAARAFKTLSS